MKCGDCQRGLSPRGPGLSPFISSPVASSPSRVAPITRVRTAHVKRGAGVNATARMGPSVPTSTRRGDRTKKPMAGLPNPASGRRAILSPLGGVSPGRRFRRRSGLGLPGRQIEFIVRLAPRYIEKYPVDRGPSSARRTFPERRSLSHPPCRAIRGTFAVLSTLAAASATTPQDLRLVPSTPGIFRGLPERDQFRDPRNRRPDPAGSYLDARSTPALSPGKLLVFGVYLLTDV